MLALVSFATGLPDHLGYDDTGSTSTECGSVLMPNFVSTFSRGTCEDTLAVPRIVVISFSAAAAVGSRFGAARSGSVGRMHTRAWEALLVVGVLAVFLLVWALMAWVFANLAAYEPG